MKSASLEHPFHPSTPFVPCQILLRLLVLLRCGVNILRWKRDGKGSRSNQSELLSSAGWPTVIFQLIIFNVTVHFIGHFLKWALIQRLSSLWRGCESLQFLFFFLLPPFYSHNFWCSTDNGADSGSYLMSFMGIRWQGIISIISTELLPNFG